MPDISIGIISTIIILLSMGWCLRHPEPPDDGWPDQYWRDLWQQVTEDCE